MKTKKTGRPTIFSAALAKEICRRLAGGQSLRAVCADKAMPNRDTVLGWLETKPDFSGQYARAREHQADLLAEEIVEIADRQVIGVKTTTKADGTVETVAADMIEHRRLQVDARKWAAAKMAPKKYGERLVNEHTGKDGGPIETKETSDIDRARRIAFFLGRAADKGKL